MRGSRLFNLNTCLECPGDLGRELHERRRGHASVDAVDEDAGPDGVRHRAELGLLVGAPPLRSQLPREGGGEPLAHLVRHRVRLHLAQLVVLVRQPPAGQKSDVSGRSRTSGTAAAGPTLFRTSFFNWEVVAFPGGVKKVCLQGWFCVPLNLFCVFRRAVGSGCESFEREVRYY